MSIYKIGNEEILCSPKVLTGEHDTTVAQGETRHNVKSIVNHEKFNIQTLEYDFSILEIDCSEEIDLTDRARAACLPNSGRAILVS